jgi:SAM-dependent MidA family methyltransferase
MGEETFLMELAFPDAQRVFNRLYYQRGGRYAEDFTTANSRGPRLAYAEAEDFYKHICGLKKRGELPEAVRILELGCGNGNGTAFFLDRLKQLDEKGKTGLFGRVECVLADFSSQMLDDARLNRHLQAHRDILTFTHTNVETLKLPGEDFLLVRSNELFDDLPTQMLVFEEDQFQEVWLSMHLSQRVPLHTRDGARIARGDFARMAQHLERWLSSVDGSFVKHLELEAVRRRAVPDLTTILLLAEEFGRMPSGITIPVPLAASSVLMQLKPLMNRHGRLDAFDYGFNSLSELKKLQPAIFRTPGALTTFVNFPYLTRFSKIAGFRHASVEPQAAFIGGKRKPAPEDAHFHHLRLEA